MLELDRLAIVDREDPVATADDVDDPRLRFACRASLIRGIDGPEGEVKVIRILDQGGPASCRPEPGRQGRLQIECRESGFEVARRRPVDVDPEQGVLAEVFRQPFGDIDVTIVTVGVVQARLWRALGDGCQRSDPSSSAPTRDRIARPYWRTFIARSAPCSVAAMSVGRAVAVGR